MKRAIVQFLCAMTLVAAVSVPKAQAQSYPWKNAAPFPSATNELYGVAVGNTIYVLGGFAGNPLGLVYSYDTAKDTWTKKAAMALPAHHVMYTEAGGKIYIFGGFVHPDNDPFQPTALSWKPINNSWAYDPSSDTWKALAPMPTPRGAGEAVSLNGKIYVIGGVNSGIPGNLGAPVHPTGPDRVVGTCEVYTISSNAWGKCADMPTPRNHYVAEALNGKIYAIDGRIGAAYVIGPSSITDNIEVYDPATNTWSDLGRSPMPRGDISGAVYNGKICIAGGEYGSVEGKMAYWSFECYDPSKPAWSAWEELPHMIVPRHGFAAAVVGNTFHAIGGSFQSDGIPGVSSLTATHEVYTFGP